MWKGVRSGGDLRLSWVSLAVMKMNRKRGDMEDLGSRFGSKL